jgi:hypothetical protein
MMYLIKVYNLEKLIKNFYDIEIDRKDKNK